MNKLTLKSKIIIAIITLFLLILQFVISGFIYKTIQYLNMYIVMFIDLLLSLSPAIFLAFIIKKFNIIKKAEKPLDKQTLNEAFEKAGKITLTIFMMIALYILYVVFFKEIYNTLFSIGDKIMGFFARDFEELIFTWNLSSDIDVVALLLAILIIVFFLKHEDKKERKKQLVASLVISLIAIILFLLEAIPTGKDLRDYYHLKDISVFHKHCIFEKFIVYSTYKGGDSIYIKCKFNEKIKFKTPLFMSVICNLPEDYKCSEKDLKEKNIILIKSLHSEYTYGLKLNEEPKKTF